VACVEVLADGICAAGDPDVLVAGDLPRLPQGKSVAPPESLLKEDPLMDRGPAVAKRVLRSPDWARR
jgi:hypothetical protein